MLDQYISFFHEEFEKQLKKYKSLKKRVQNKVDYILKNPYNSELLGKAKIDLRGKRSIRITKNFRLIFSICEECIKRGYEEFNLPYCKDICEKRNDLIIFLTFGPHQVSYKKK